jgi:Zn-dependent protease
MLTTVPANMISRAVVLLIAISAHQIAHAWAALLAGRRSSPLTVDPRVNVDGAGLAAGVLTGYAIPGIAPVGAEAQRQRPWIGWLPVLAGPLANLFLAALFAVPFRLGWLPYVPLTINHFVPSITNLMFDMIWLNVIMAILSLIPLFPMDGWLVALWLLPDPITGWMKRYERQSQYLLYALIAIPILLSLLGHFLESDAFIYKLNVLLYVVLEPGFELVRWLMGV